MIDCVKVQRHIFVFYLATIGTFFPHILDSFAAGFGVWSGSKTFFGPTYVNNLFVFILVKFGAFAFFRTFGASFVVGARFKNFWDLFM